MHVFQQIKLLKCVSAVSFGTRVTTTDYTFITPFGRFFYQRIPYGISSAPEHFQKRISALLQGIEEVVCLMDDSLIVGRNQQEHDTRLHAVLRHLMDVNITLNSKL